MNQGAEIEESCTSSAKLWRLAITNVRDGRANADNADALLAAWLLGMSGPNSILALLTRPGGASVAELSEVQPLVNDLRATLVERTSLAQWILCVPSGDYGLVLDMTWATRPTFYGTANGQVTELVLTYVKFPTAIDIVVLKMALEHWQRDSRTWPPPSWEIDDKGQWTRDQLTRVVRGPEALRSRVIRNSDWGTFWCFANEVETAVLEFLQVPRPPRVAAGPMVDNVLATTLPDDIE